MKPVTAPLVLVVEDDEKNRKLARDILQHRGLEVCAVASAEEALEAAAARRPDVVLLDIQLPGMSGLDAIARLRAMPQLAPVPVIAFTASVMPSEKQLVMAAGFDAFVFKPITLADFVAAVERCLATGRS